MARTTAAALLALAAIACGAPPAGTPSGAGGAELSGPDRAALLGAIGLAPDGAGMVVNECGDKVQPTIQGADFGGAVGVAQVVAIGGGASMAACYGDGPDLHVLMRDGEGWREIYGARGRMLVILPTSTDGVRDIADGGPGFDFPLWQWNGSEYAWAHRSVTDAETANAVILP